MMALSDEARSVLQALVDDYLDGTATSLNVTTFRLRHEEQRQAIVELLNEGYLRAFNDAYTPTLRGLVAAANSQAEQELRRFDALLPVLKDAFRERPNAQWTVEELAAKAGLDPAAVSRTLSIFAYELPIFGSWGSAPGGRVVGGVLTEGVLDI